MYAMTFGISHTCSKVFPTIHDRSKFDIYCFALNFDDSSTYYHKICDESEHFIDLSKVTDLQAANLINSLGMNILINLNGHTEGEKK